ncbi:hypothetical protein SLS58_010970 [Diplodia intermedia]|uniref:Uncharacterized protein n=1 Tax=Diplodia intermedia TaxID=856260 RepID=A0ABR3T3K4_9PEZI
MAANVDSVKHGPVTETPEWYMVHIEVVGYTFLDQYGHPICRVDWIAWHEDVEAVGKSTGWWNLPSLSRNSLIRGTALSRHNPVQSPAVRGTAPRCPRCEGDQKCRRRGYLSSLMAQATTLDAKNGSDIDAGIGKAKRNGLDP